MTRLSPTLVFFTIVFLAFFQLINHLGAEKVEGDLSYSKVPVVTWQLPQIVAFFEKEFPNELDSILANVESSNLSGSDLILMENDDFEALGVANAETRRQMLARIHYYADKAAGNANNEDQEFEELDLYEYYLQEDSDRPEHERRYDINKLQIANKRRFFLYLSNLNNGPSFTYAYLYFKNPKLLRAILHLPQDHEFTLEDFFKYFICGRFFIIYKLFSLGYFDLFPLVALFFIFVQACNIFASLLELYTMKFINPLSGTGMLLMTSLSLNYFTPEMLINWWIIGFTAIFGSIVTVVQAYVQARFYKLSKSIREKKQAKDAKNNTSDDSTHLENAPAIPEGKEKHE